MMLPRKYRELKEKYAYAFEFEQRFFDIPEEEKQPDFYKRLLQLNGNITKTDIKIAWFLKENSEYLGSSAHNIGKQLDIDPKNLTNFFRKLSYGNISEFQKANLERRKK